jgi:hypothetical protein
MHSSTVLCRKKRHDLADGKATQGLGPHWALLRFQRLSAQVSLGLRLTDSRFQGPTVHVSPDSGSET